MTTIDSAPGHTDLDALEQAARAATPGPWAFDPLTQDGWAILANFPEPERPYGYGLAVTWSREDAAYIALASPDVILRLIAAVREADALREERDRLRTIEHAARDVDGAWFTESDEDQAPILWIAEAGEILLDLRAALSATEPAE